MHRQPKLTSTMEWSNSKKTGLDKNVALRLDEFRVVRTHPHYASAPILARDKRLHLVANARDLQALCSLQVAEVLAFMPVSEFGRVVDGRRTEKWCGLCAKKLSQIEKWAGL